MKNHKGSGFSNEAHKFSAPFPSAPKKFFWDFRLTPHEWKQMGGQKKFWPPSPLTSETTWGKPCPHTIRHTGVCKGNHIERKEVISVIYFFEIWSLLALISRRNYWEGCIFIQILHCSKEIWGGFRWSSWCFTPRVTSCSKICWIFVKSK